MSHDNGAPGGLGDTPTASLAAAIAASEDGVAAIPVEAAEREHGMATLFDVAEVAA